MWHKCKFTVNLTAINHFYWKKNKTQKKNQQKNPPAPSVEHVRYRFLFFFFVIYEIAKLTSISSKFASQHLATSVIHYHRNVIDGHWLWIVENKFSQELIPLFGSLRHMILMLRATNLMLMVCSSKRLVPKKSLGHKTFKSTLTVWSHASIKGLASSTIMWRCYTLPEHHWKPPISAVWCEEKVISCFSVISD